MWKQHASWIEVLDSCPGLNLHEKSRARIIILAKPHEDRELYFQGTYAEVAATIKALLRETPVGDPGASPSATALRLTLCGDQNLEDRSESLRASSTNVSSSNSASSCASRRPSARELLVETAALVRHLGTLPSAFRSAHFRASQPGEIYCRTFKELLPATTTVDGRFIPSFERARVKFAMVVSVSLQSPRSSSSSSAASASSSSSSSFSLCKSDPETATVIAVRIRSLEGYRRRSMSSKWPLMEYEAELVPEPADTLDAVLERLEKGTVRPAEVLWWTKGPGKWCLWNGSPLRSWCKAV